MKKIETENGVYIYEDASFNPNKLLCADEIRTIVCALIIGWGVSEQFKKDASECFHLSRHEKLVHGDNGYFCVEYLRTMKAYVDDAQLTYEQLERLFKYMQEFRLVCAALMKCGTIEDHNDVDRFWTYKVRPIFCIISGRASEMRK